MPRRDPSIVAAAFTAASNYRAMLNASKEASNAANEPAAPEGGADAGGAAGKGGKPDAKV